MPRDKATPRIPEKEWAKHRDVIRSLYIEQGKKLQGEDGVIDIMTRLHGFSATKAQYETRFKKWGYGKNSNASEWRTIARIVKSRSMQGKKTEILRDGRLITSHRIRQEISRFGLHQIETQISSDTPIPGNIRVRTPTFRADISYLLSGLPIFNLAPYHKEADVEYRPLTGQSMRSTHNDGNLALYSKESLAWPLIQVDIFNHIQSRIEHSQLETTVSTAKSLLPYDPYDSPFKADPLTASDPRQFSSTYMQLLLYSLTNNLIDDKHPALKVILAHFNGTEKWQLTRYLQRNGFAMKALAERIFRLSIRWGDANLVDHFLQNRVQGINVLDQVFPLGGSLVNPIEASIWFHETAVARVLLSHLLLISEASTFKENLLSQAFGYLHQNISEVSDQGESETLPSEVVAATDDDSVIREHIKNRRSEIVAVMMLPHLRTKGQYWADHGFITNIIEYIEIHVALKVVKGMCEVGVNLNNHYDSISAFQAALEGASVELVNILLDILGMNFSSHAMKLSIRAKNIPAVKEIIQRWGAVDIIYDSVRPLRHIAERWYPDMEVSTPEDGCYGEELRRKRLHQGKLSKDRVHDETPYSEAILFENTELMQLLERHGSLSNITEVRRYCAAITAGAAVGNIAVVEYLLGMLDEIYSNSQEPVLNACTSLRAEDDVAEALETCLYSSIKLKDENMTNILTQAGAILGQFANRKFPDEIEPDWKTALQWRQVLNADAFHGSAAPLYRAVAIHHAIQLNDPDLLARLLDWWHECRHLTHFSNVTPQLLRRAVEEGSVKCVHVLIEKGARFDDCRETSLLALAVKHKNREMICCLLSLGADPADEEAFKTAIGRPACLVHLLEAFSDRYPEGKQGFGARSVSKAVTKAPEVLLMLMRAKFDVNGYVTNRSGKFCSDQQEKPLLAAIERGRMGDQSALKLLLEEGADPNSIVLFCSEESYIEVDHKIEEVLHEIEGSRCTALLRAIEYRSIQSIETLIKAGATFHSILQRGVNRTPLQMAAEVGDYDIVTFLLDLGVEVNAAPSRWRGGTALQLAAIGGFAGIACLLLSKGAGVNAPRARSHGRTALEGAAEHGRLDMVKLLLNAGAQLDNSVKGQYQRALCFAEQHGHHAVVDMLLSHQPVPPHGSESNQEPNSTVEPTFPTDPSQHSQDVISTTPFSNAFDMQNQHLPETNANPEVDYVSGVECSSSNPFGGCATTFPTDVFNTEWPSYEFGDAFPFPDEPLDVLMQDQSIFGVYDPHLESSSFLGQ